MLDRFDRQTHLIPAARVFLIGRNEDHVTSVAPVEQETIRGFLMAIEAIEASGGERWRDGGSRQADHSDRRGGIEQPDCYDLARSGCRCR